MTGRFPKEKVVFSLRESIYGWIGVAAGEGGLLRILIRPDRREVERSLLERWPEAIRTGNGMTDAALRQLDEFFRGRRRGFDLPLDFRGLPPFTAEILRQLKDLPFGERITYGGLAALAGRPGAARAVGRAMATNPFPVVVPCHRVVGAGGRLTGYSGGEGVATKARLLEFEKKLKGEESSGCLRD